ncbi:MAG: hypothetical protein JKY31_10420 [Rhodobacteraceae bacterium]|nr:hypothetical protein [Paracoccaceae bacterium]
MIITIPRHVTRSADLSARAQIPYVSRVLLAMAHFFAGPVARPVAPKAVYLSDHLRRDIGQNPAQRAPAQPSTHGVFLGR